MKQTIYHKCGHESFFETMDTRNNRITKAEEYGEDDCLNCMAQYAYDNGLPDLEGTAKQIKWAFFIRHKKLTETNGEWDADECDAKYWIDNRSKK